MLIVKTQEKTGIETIGKLEKMLRSQIENEEVVILPMHYLKDAYWIDKEGNITKL